MESILDMPKKATVKDLLLVLADAEEFADIAFRAPEKAVCLHDNLFTFSTWR
jgi:hypothetical protein